MNADEQVNFRVAKTLSAKVRKDAKRTNRSGQALLALALQHFYALKDFERTQLILAQTKPQGGGRRMKL